MSKIKDFGFYRQRLVGEDVRKFGKAEIKKAEKCEKVFEKEICSEINLTKKEMLIWQARRQVDKLQYKIEAEYLKRVDLYLKDNLTEEEYEKLRLNVLDDCKIGIKIGHLKPISTKNVDAAIKRVKKVKREFSSLEYARSVPFMQQIKQLFSKQTRELESKTVVQEKSFEEIKECYRQNLMASELFIKDQMRSMGASDREIEIFFIDILKDEEIREKLESIVSLNAKDVEEAYFRIRLSFEYVIFFNANYICP